MFLIPGRENFVIWSVLNLYKKLKHHKTYFGLFNEISQDQVNLNT